ncbi:interleukin-1 receptor type 2-like isoform X1 [Parambassis ranga]|uniref:Soluble interferon alpha/beta receptor OPG204 n=2 Tax=Parambassis ranga TaxID=210632 RepID=A0A6P7JID0_9TELE|nr:interleukin-1 receptor type 2-like isoform X1 [Parambassis ranga]
MKLLSVVKALGSLCLVFASGYPVSEADSPEIIGPDHIQLKVNSGERLVLHCDAFTNCEEDEAMIYWLVNGTFPEETLSRERIVESHKSTLDQGTIIQKSLVLKNITSEDLKSTFTCVVTTAVGMAQKHITLATTISGCSKN